MPNISASDYTTYLKYKAAALAYSNNIPPRPIQTVDQVSPNVNIINSYLTTSQAAYVVNKNLTTLGPNLNYVRPMPPNNVNHPKAISTVSQVGGGPYATIPAGTTNNKIQNNIPPSVQ